MFKHKRGNASALSVIALTSATCIVLAACGGSDNEQANGDVVITWWDRMDTDGQKATISEWISSFEAENPGIKIDRTYVPPEQYTQKVLSAAAGGETPDIILYDAIDTAMYAEAGVLTDLSSYFETRADSEAFIEDVLAGGVYNEALYQVPYNVQIMGLFANEDIIGPDNLPENLEELESVMMLAAEDGHTGLSAALADPFATYTFTPFLYTFGGSYEDFGSSETLDAVRYLNGLIDNQLTNPDAATTKVLEAIDPFMQGRSAFAMNGTWMIGSIQADEALVEKIRPVPFPSSKSSPGHSVALANGASIMEGSSHKDEAWKVIEWITSQDQSLLLSENTGALSPRNDVLVEGGELLSNNEYLRVFNAELETALPRPSTPKWAEIEEAVTNMIQSVAAGDATAEDAVDKAAVVVSEALG